jgi:hypothetical protein
MLLSKVEYINAFAVAFQSLSRRTREIEKSSLSSHAILRHHSDPSYAHRFLHSYSCCVRGAELLLPNRPSRQCHHLPLAVRFVPLPSMFVHLL